jgi:hypothetical protein
MLRVLLHNKRTVAVALKRYKPGEWICNQENAEVITTFAFFKANTGRVDDQIHATRIIEIGEELSQLPNTDCLNGILVDRVTTNKN